MYARVHYALMHTIANGAALCMHAYIMHACIQSVSGEG